MLFERVLLVLIYKEFGGCNGVVGIVTELRAGGSMVRFPLGQRIFSSP